MRLFQSHRSEKYFENNTYISTLISNCQRFPLAIALIGAQRIENQEEWREALLYIQSSHAKPASAEYDFNLYQTFSYSISKLPSVMQRQFRKLGVFKKGKIPLTMISMLWNSSISSTKFTLQELNDKSLLNLLHETNNDNARYCKCSIITNEKV